MRLALGFPSCFILRRDNLLRENRAVSDPEKKADRKSKRTRPASERAIERLKWKHLFWKRVA
jgi:hypothetical protein